ncbi:MAG: hypothetical protein ACOX81_05890 [Candidatus Heteroscillospira sp.]|jgi:hypothetical protein
MPLETARKKLLMPCAWVIILLLLFALAPRLRAPETELMPILHGGEEYLPLGDGFAALDSSGIAVYDKHGELLFDEKLPLSPELSASDGELLAVCAENSVRLYSPKGMEGLLPAEDGEILALELLGGSLAVSRTGGYYPCTVTFYARTTPLFRRCLSSGVCRELLLTEKGACLMLEDELVFLSGPDEAARITLPGVKALLAADKGVCAQTGDALYFFKMDGSNTGTFEDRAGIVRSFSGEICAQTEDGILLLNTDGSVRAVYDGERPLRFGTGLRPTVICGEKTLIFDENLEITQTIENKYIPVNVITDKNAAVVLWPLAAEIHRK